MTPVHVIDNCWLRFLCVRWVIVFLVDGCWRIIIIMILIIIYLPCSAKIQRLC